MTARKCSRTTSSGHLSRRGHDIVAIIMKEDLDSAFDWLAEYREQIQSNFKVQNLVACLYSGYIR